MLCTPPLYSHLDVSSTMDWYHWQISDAYEFSPSLLPEKSPPFLLDGQRENPLANSPKSTPLFMAKPVTNPCWWSTCAPSGQTLYGLKIWYWYLSIVLFLIFTPLRYKQVTTELPDGYQKALHPMMFSLMVSTMYFTSSSLTYGPAVRHIPTLNKASDTPFT